MNEAQKNIFQFIGNLRNTKNNDFEENGDFRNLISQHFEYKMTNLKPRLGQSKSHPKGERRREK